MSLPTMNGVARLIDAPELRFSAQGKAVVKVRLAFNARKKDPATNEWVDGDSFFIDGTAFERTAESIAESLDKGMEVVVSGRLRTDRWETKQGEKRSGTSLLIDSIGPSLRSATAKVTKASSSGGGRQEFQQTRQQQSAGSGDPWSAAAQQAGQGAGSWSGDEPPF